MACVIEAFETNQADYLCEAFETNQADYQADTLYASYTSFTEQKGKLLPKRLNSIGKECELHEDALSIKPSLFAFLVGTKTGNKLLCASMGPNLISSIVNR